MGHVDPLLAVPLGAAFAVVSAWFAVAPDRIPRESGRVRVLDRLVGERATNVVVRVGGVVMAVGSGWLAVHAARAALA